ncbi:type IV pilus assembly protein PilX [Povalibacter uvarum]|uniref:Type IV pilus assembly protein PilX n=1 Tax=Povalibacter uvarum TaxID=732238 RepID=A0A841HH02_9GAMM|nr:PilX N-terminal domain-containing pilus assembly protein [Povalibacter uvarum]MBB6091844.1 type IV pilus assembly protein PilX [Povalibacter uvarum]
MRTTHLARRERGASLLVALIFLVIMAMLGVTVANVTNMQERMAGGTRDRDLALQAAEAALRDAENRLQVQAFRDAVQAFDPANGNDVAFWDACFAGTAAPCETASRYEPETELPGAGAPGALAEQPQYVIERKVPDGTIQIFRITARAVGGTEDAVVILQSEIGFSTPP